MKITFLGTGTSQGIPVPLCSCSVCNSTNPKDNRLRASVYLESQDLSILIDTSIDFRAQMLRYKIPKIDAVLQTHHHFDHLFGLDDIRAFTQKQKTAIDFYTSPQCEPEVRSRFGYAFEEGNLKFGLPQLTMRIVKEPFEIKKNSSSVKVVPIEIGHGKIDIYGFRINDFAYMTDCKSIPETSFKKLENLEILVLDCLRYEPHPTHLSLNESLNYIRIIKPKKTYLTHFNHDIAHEKLSSELKDFDFSVEPAYDGLIIEAS
ncbi:MAG: MBL fold metallo-hydrolase [Chloroherpetonaceae bacterium]|nr:MBL fold metallo-hydrolase [Chloroherpetonaceae bacterium]